MRCPKCRERLARTREDGVLVTGRYLLIKSESFVISCKRCRTLVEVKNPTVVKVTKKNDD